VLKEHGEPVSGTKAELIERLKAIGQEGVLLEHQMQSAYRNGVGQAALDLALQHVEKGLAKNLAEAFTLDDVKALCDKQPITAKLFDDVCQLQQIVRAHPLANELLQYGLPEVSLIAYDRDYDLYVKCRFDFLSFDDAGIDLKTAENPSPRAFAKSVRDYRYCVQQAFYTRVAQLLNIDIVVFAFIAIGTGANNDVVVYELDEQSIAKATTEMLSAMAKYAQAVKEDTWPGYGENDVVQLSVW
jgi:hypothetical protein